MDIATLKALNPGEFQQAADGYRTTGDTAADSKDHIDNVVVAQMRKSLKGEALEAAVRELNKLSANFHYTQIECGLVTTALNGFAYDMDAARKKLLSALDDAAAKNYPVGANGSVSYPEGVPPNGVELPPKGGTVIGSAIVCTVPDPEAAKNHHRAPAQAIADRIAVALQEAGEADAKWAPKIEALTADDDLTVSDKDMRDSQSDMGGVREAGDNYLKSVGGPPKDATPQQVADWWKGLDPDQQTALLSAQPDLIGRLDGIPSETRDEANRVVLAQHQGSYRDQLSTIPKPPQEWTYIYGRGFATKVHTDEWTAWNKEYGDRYRHMTGALKGMDSIQSRIDATGKEGLPEAYILGFSPEGNGRAIVATGNPDTAQHQAVYVPGTTANLEKVGGDIDRMTEMWRQTQASTPGASVSTITWLGYDAPQDIVKDAPFEHYAYDGAPAYRNFMDGLEVTHSGPGEPHRTAVGHSYGTTLIGAAAETGKLNADDVVFAGSPGVKVGSAEEMDVPKGHVWNQEADGDKVPDIGRYGHGGTQGGLDGGIFIVPSDDLFGANQMNTGAEGSGPTATQGAEGHSEYWKHGSTALKNQALVVTGNYGNVTTPE